MMNNATIIRVARFNAAHRLNNPEWDAEKNKSVFGLCNKENYHGHNYKLEVYITGKVQEDTGFVIDTKLLKDIILEEIEERFDHKNLNLDCIEFEHLNPTVENIAIVIYNLLRSKIAYHLDVKIKLFETENNIAIYPALAV